jgi:hypothetical protein
MSDTVRELGRVVGLFVTVGIGLGLAGFLLVTQFEAGSSSGTGASLLGGLLFLQAIAVLYFVGPVVAAVGGVFVGLRDSDRATGVLAGGIGSFVGSYLLFAIGLGILLLAAESGGGGGGGFDVGENILAIAGVGAPAALVGAVSAALAGGRSKTASRTNW